MKDERILTDPIDEEGQNFLHKLCRKFSTSPANHSAHKFLKNFPDLAKVQDKYGKTPAEYFDPNISKLNITDWLSSMSWLSFMSSSRSSLHTDNQYTDKSNFIFIENFIFRMSNTELDWSNLNNYKIEEKIGEGTYGVVYRGYFRPNGKKVALKKIRVEGEDEGIPSTR